MISPEIVDLTSDDEHAEENIKAVKIERGLVEIKNDSYHSVLSGQLQAVKTEKCLDQNRITTTPATSQSKDSALEQALSPVDDTSLASSSARCPAPICRQFWKAGSYSDTLAPNTSLQSMIPYALHFYSLTLSSFMF